MKSVLLFTLLCLGFSGTVFAQQKADADSKRMRPALLVIDIQNKFLPMVEEREKEVGLYMINAMIDLFRKEGYPVILVYHSDPEDGPKQGTDEFNFPASVKILPTDPLVIKHHASGFKQTDLEKILKEHNINTVFISGMSAVGCALATYMEAGDLDYNAFIVKHGLMSHMPEYTKKIEEIFAALSYNTIKTMLENAVK